MSRGHFSFVKRKRGIEEERRVMDDRNTWRDIQSGEGEKKRGIKQRKRVEMKRRIVIEKKKEEVEREKTRVRGNKD